MEKEFETTEYDGRKIEPMPNTPQNHKKAAETKEKAILFALEMNKKYDNQ